MKSIIIVFLFLLSACSTTKQYSIVITDTVDLSNDSIITQNINDMRLGFEKSSCSWRGIEKNRCIDIGNYTGDKLSTDLVKLFIEKYNTKHNTNFNAMKNVEIREVNQSIFQTLIYQAHVSTPPSYLIKGILLEAR